MTSSTSSSLRTTMRIIAVPLTTPARVASSVPKPSRLTYYHFQNPPKALKETKSVAATEGWLKLPDGGRLASWATLKASSTWADFGKEKSGWKSKVYQNGERVRDKVEFEEIALRNLDPALGPSIPNPTTQPGRLMQKKGENEQTKIPLIYPPSLFPSPSFAISELQAHAAERIELHRRWLYIWSAAIPPTIPLKLIPIIPNFPFFFSAWRAWSHYQASKSAEYLHAMLKHDMIVPQASAELDEVYKLRQIPFNSTSSESTGTPPEFESESDSQQELLTHPDIPTLVSLPLFQSSQLEGAGAATGTLEADLRRAIDQARERVSGSGP